MTRVSAITKGFNLQEEQVEDDNFCVVLVPPGLQGHRRYLG